MAHSQFRHPHFIFSVDSIEPHPDFHPRIERGSWQPPRPNGSNIIGASQTSGRLYEYSAGSVQRANAIGGNWQAFRTYSFYFSEGILKVYPSDATVGPVGDGTGNPPRTRTAQRLMRTSSDGRRQSSGEEQSTYDWRPLSFNFPANDNGSQTTQACFRGNQLTFGVVRNETSHMNTLLQLLPNACFANLQRIDSYQTSNGLLCGGLVGQIPVLIALVAFSVAPNHVEQALLGCFQNPYAPHGHQRTVGWIEGRGLRVRIWCQGGEVSARGANSPSDVLLAFEEGRLPGYHKFVQ